MIVDQDEMKSIISSCGIPKAQLAVEAGKEVAEQLRKELKPGARILLLAGSMTIGIAGISCVHALRPDYEIHVFLVHGQAASKQMLAMAPHLPSSAYISRRKLSAMLKESDAIIDAVYGMDYPGKSDHEEKILSEEISSVNAAVYSIDINAGCFWDGRCDSHALHSRITFALGAYRPFHMMRKVHHMFEEVRMIPLPVSLPAETHYHEMNEDLFFAGFPRKNENAYKGTYGKTLLISGCYGMAGAACLNILGAKTMGAPYIIEATGEEVYPVIASHFVTPVFQPFGHESWYEVIEPLIPQAKAIGFGSGAVYMDHKSEILDLLLQNATVPLVLDAEAIRLLKHNTYILRFAKSPVILTPHIGEFSYMTGIPIEAIRNDRINIVRKFAEDYKVMVVLKDPNTLVVSSCGDIYINQSGNQALAQAGSGDVLTGIMTALLSMTSDVFTAVCMAVWIHGYLAQLGTKDHSIQNFSLLDFPKLMDQLFYKHGF